MRLITNRLILRGFEPGDLAELHAILGDAETMKYLEAPFSVAQTKSFLEDFCIGQRGALAVKLKDGGVIGYMLFHPTSPDTYEIGWVFNRAFWRQGYAYEAASAVIEYGFKEMKLKKIIAESVDPYKSPRLMRKLGMIQEGVMKTKDAFGEDADMYLYSIKNGLGCDNV